MPTANPLALAIVTGHGDSIKATGNTDYLDELLARDRWINTELDNLGIESLVGKPCRIYQLEVSGRLARVPSESLIKVDTKGRRQQVRTGKISREYAEMLKNRLSNGDRLIKRTVIGRKEIRNDHGFALKRERGRIVPANFHTKMLAAALGNSETLPRREGNRLCGAILRRALRGLPLHNHAIKIAATGRKHVRHIASHNVVFAPSPGVLAAIKAQGCPIDSFLERVARLALEKLERQRNAKITAICATHIQDSSGFRPHLHLRMIAYDSQGKYIRLFDRTQGKRGTNRCILQEETERLTRVTLERWEGRVRES